MKTPPYRLAEPWFNGRCKVELYGTVYDVFMYEMPVRLRRWVATRDGQRIAEKAKFITLVRELARLNKHV